MFWTKAADWKIRKQMQETPNDYSEYESLHYLFFCRKVNMKSKATLFDFLAQVSCNIDMQ